MPSPRAEALRLTRNTQEIVPPPMPDLAPNSAAALEFVNGIKEPRYASLARTIDLLFEHVAPQITYLVEGPPEAYRPEQKPIVPPSGPWHQLSYDLRSIFGRAQTEISDTKTYEQTEQFTKIAGRLDNGLDHNLDLLLMRGLATGVVSTLVLLRNLPQITKHRQPGSSIDKCLDIARHTASTILSRRLAKICVNQMLAARYTLSIEDTDKLWVDGNTTVLDPEKFQLHQHADGSQSLGYADFPNMRVPEGFRPHPTAEYTEKPTLIGDIPCRQAKTVGCPITLVQGRLAELLHWSVDAVEARRLWEETWPPLSKY